ncbi:hypothetical protein L596_005201 [Steinernema carpocapsae]|uniref:Uncharacterized protein n=1 Tax=Steinernema carpocapsae TaxID=34508 RepID=A0A4U8UYH3_STECR|nr:hypothetical protein L596_005201 [Steinernema carpocapsae]
MSTGLQNNCRAVNSFRRITQLVSSLVPTTNNSVFHMVINYLISPPPELLQADSAAAGRSAWWHIARRQPEIRRIRLFNHIAFLERLAQPFILTYPFDAAF